VGGAQTQPVREADIGALATLMQVDQQRVTALDTVTVAIKGWVVALDSALVGVAFAEGRHALLLVAAAATSLFLPLDLHYRQVQLLHADRSRRIEQLIAPEYRLRPDRSTRTPRSPLGRLATSGYLSTTVFYGVVLALLFAVLLVD
jgi:hypothetical protein